MGVHVSPLEYPRIDFCSKTILLSKALRDPVYGSKSVCNSWPDLVSGLFFDTKQKSIFKPGTKSV